MVWNGVEWCGVVWSGVEWCGVVWNGDVNVDTRVCTKPLLRTFHFWQTKGKQHDIKADIDACMDLKPDTYAISLCLVLVQDPIHQLTIRLQLTLH